MSRVMRLLLILIATLCVARAGADDAHAQNQRARKLHEQGKYDEALEVYDQAIVEAPQEYGLHANRASTLHRLERFDEAFEAGEGALQSENRDLKADVHYNRGNALYRLGQQQMSSGDQKAMESFKGALQEYISALKIRPGDRDAKWNLQLAHAQAKQAEQQQQEQEQQEKERNASEYAKKMKKKADEQVAIRAYRKALTIMKTALKKDKTASVYQNYTQRLEQVCGIKK